MTLAIEISGVRKAFGDFVAVDDLSVAVPRGCVYGLLGPNGAGKTTTLRMLMDILAPDAGEIRIDGRPRTRADLARIGYLPEERGLYPKMTLTDQLVFLGELHGLSRRDATARVGPWLERVGLADRAGRRVEELSKGMQQKVQLVGTVLHDPEILVLDEPFSGLDPINQAFFKELLADYRRQGRTIVLSTHVLEHAEKLCERICLLARGRAVLEGDLAELKRRRGGHVYRLRARGALAELASLPGVLEAQTDDGGARLVLADDAVPSDLLRLLATRYAVEEFRCEEPDLETLFVQAVADE
jgi:ABC-2 type transport system ATP-binding protein